MAIGNVAFWTFFGFAVRWWQLGIQKRPIFEKATALGYPIFGGIGASFGYYMQGVQARQEALLQRRKESLLEKRARRDARKAAGEAF